AHYGETSDPPTDLSSRQLETLRAWHEDIALWSHDLSDEGKADRVTAEAREQGYDRGKAAAGRYFDGNTSEDTYRRVLQGIEEGDPAVMDTLPSCPLSGEWADEITPRGLFEDLGMSGDEDYADDVLNAYEDGFSQGATDELVRVARVMTGGSEP